MRPVIGLQKLMLNTGAAMMIDVRIKSVKSLHSMAMVGVLCFSCLAFAQTAAKKNAPAKLQTSWDDVARRMLAVETTKEANTLREAAGAESNILTLGEQNNVEAASLLASKLDLTFDIVDRYLPINRPLQQRYTAIDALVSLGVPALPAIVEALASQPRTTIFKQNAIRTVARIKKQYREELPYWLRQQWELYDDKSTRLRAWSEKLPYGEMPTRAMLEAAPIAEPLRSPKPDLTTQAGREAAIQRLTRILEFKAVLTAKDVQWAQDEDRQKVFSALDELIQLDATGDGEVGQEMARMMGFLFAPEPPKPPLPAGEFNPAFPPDPPVVPHHPIKPLIFGAVPAGSTKTETYFPAVPKLIAMGPRIAPFIADAMSERRGGQMVQNGVYTLRRILGSDDEVKKLLLEQAEVNAKKAQRLRELLSIIPSDD